MYIEIGSLYQLLNIITYIISTLICSAMGAVVSELVLIFTGKQQKISSVKVVISTMCGTFISISIPEFVQILFKFNVSLIVHFTLSFFAGYMGFDLAIKLIKLETWIQLYDKFRKK